MSQINIYTDGGCSGNQSRENFGGWGAILEYGDYRKELFGGERDTTNNRMEMTALLSAFEALKKDGLHISVFSDSSYLMNCFREGWYKKWIANGWKNSAKNPVENRDLWEKILPHLERHRDIKFYRVKGHVNLTGKNVDLDGLYRRFIEWNGARFSFEDFKYITAMNNRADELANMGIGSIRSD